MLIVEANEVRKSFDHGEARVDALRGVTLHVTVGEFVAIMGPSGSGKSTLLHILGGVETPTSGKVAIDGVDIASLDDNVRTRLRRDKIGYIFQMFNLFPTLTAEENVALPLVLNRLQQQSIRARVTGMLERVSIGHRRNHVPSEMSGGERQRVAIARALVIEPAVLLADEPTGNLDSATGLSIIQLLRQLVDEQRQTLLVVTHDPTVADHADRIVRLRDGLLETHK